MKTCKCCCPSVATVEEKTREAYGEKFLWAGGASLAIALWGILYSQLVPLSAWVVSHLPVERTGRFHDAVAFFVYDAPKVLLLLTLVVFAMGVVRSFFSPERTRVFLAGKHEGIGNIAAACLGIVTPFCSCSAVPLFIGFLSAGVPLGVTFSFLIAAPMVNEIALGLLFGLVGWKVALAYLAFGLGVAIATGWIIGRLNLEGWLEAWVRQARASKAEEVEVRLTSKNRIELGMQALRDIAGKVWPWMLAGIAVGAFIHGYAPEELLSSVMGSGAWWSVPAGVLIGVPMYSHAGGIIPVVEALLEKGAALGTVLAFMMSVTALSLPEMIILRKVLSVRLLAVFFGIVASGILMVGYVFNVMWG